MIGRFIKEQSENGLYVAGGQERMDNYLALLEGLPGRSIHTDRPREKNDDEMYLEASFRGTFLTVYEQRLCRRIMMTQTLTGQLNGGLEMI